MAIEKPKGNIKRTLIIASFNEIPEISIKIIKYISRVRNTMKLLEETANNITKNSTNNLILLSTLCSILFCVA